MSENKCNLCENYEHTLAQMAGELTDMIEVDGKYFCPNTYERIIPEDEAEEMSEEEINEVYSEKVVLVRPAKYKIIKAKKEEKKAE